MESLAFLHYAVACQALTPPPQLRSFGELDWQRPGIAGMKVVSLAVLLCVGKTLSEVMISDRAVAQAQTNAIGTAIVNTQNDVGVRTRSTPNGAIVGGRVEGVRVFLTGRQADAGGLRWAQLTDGSWVATPYIAYENVATLVVQPAFESWNTDVGAGSTAIVRTRLGVGVNTRNRPAGAPVGGRVEGARVVLTGAQADAGGFRWAQLRDGTWAATPYLALERATTPRPAPPEAPEPPPEPAPPQGTTERIEFAPGETSATVSNTVRQGTRDTYFLQAQRNQTMAVQLTSTQDDAVFRVVAPDGTTLGQETTNWQGTLPADGDYQVIVRSQQGDASYSLTVSITEPPPPQGITERIEFAPGETSATLRNTVARDVSNTYLLQAQRNQTLSVQLTSTQDDAVFRVVAPDGTTLVQDITNWQGTLPADGDYQVIVRSQQGDASYSLTVSITEPPPPQGITERIEFAPGKTSATLRNTVARDVSNTYLLQAQRNQTLSVQLTSTQDDAVFRVVAPDGTTLVQDITNWQGTLPADGDYQVIVRSQQGDANYSLTVSITEPPPPQGITERIEFAPGETSATLRDTVARDVSNTYRLQAQRNQTMAVQLTSTQDDAVFRVVAPDGTTLVQETRNWQGTLPADGDYQVIVRSQRGGASYTLNVSITEPTPTPTPTPTSPGTTERIEFPPGEIATTVSGTVEAGTSTTYLLDVQREEFISVTLESTQGNAVLDIVNPNGQILEEGANFWNGTASTAGDYRIIVRAAQGSASYSLRVSAANL